MPPLTLPRPATRPAAVRVSWSVPLRDGRGVLSLDGVPYRVVDAGTAERPAPARSSRGRGLLPAAPAFARGRVEVVMAGRKRPCPGCGKWRSPAGPGGLCRTCYCRRVGWPCYGCGARGSSRLCAACHALGAGLTMPDPAAEAYRLAMVPVYAERAARQVDLFAGEESCHSCPA